MRRLIASTLLLVVSGCRDQKPPPPIAPATATPSAVLPPLAPPPSASSKARPAASAGPAVSAKPVGPSPWVLEPKAHDVATGSYVAVGAAGAIFRQASDEIQVISIPVKLSDKPASIPEGGPPLARGRTLVVDRSDATAAYWVSGGRLKRRVLEAAGRAGPVEVIAEGAEEYPPHGARVGAQDLARDVVGYIAQRTTKDGERRARAWIEGKGSVDLSPDGSGGASVWLTPTSVSSVSAVWLDQRSALAPIHTASIDLAAAPRVTGGAIAWIAPPSDLVGAVSALSVDGTLVALTAQPKNGSDFGLAAVPIVPGAPPRDDAVWLDYPNGLDPAPVVPARFCDAPALVFVRPSAKPIDAPKIVMMATLSVTGHVTERIEVGRAAKIEHVAAFGEKSGGVVAWVGDGRTWVRRVRCAK